MVQLEWYRRAGRSLKPFAFTWAGRRARANRTLSGSACRRVGSLSVAAALTCAFLSFSFPSSAASGVDTHTESDIRSTPECRVSAIRASGVSGDVVLQWSGTKGTLQMKGPPVILSASEEPCASQCTRPGKDGFRVFHFHGDGVHATLRKQVSCARDAEVCHGLPAGRATLTISTGKGKTRLAARNDECDL